MWSHLPNRCLSIWKLRNEPETHSMKTMRMLRINLMGALNKMTNRLEKRGRERMRELMSRSGRQLRRTFNSERMEKMQPTTARSQESWQDPDRPSCRLTSESNCRMEWTTTWLWIAVPWLTMDSRQGLWGNTSLRRLLLCLSLNDATGQSSIRSGSPMAITTMDTRLWLSTRKSLNRWRIHSSKPVNMTESASSKNTEACQSQRKTWDCLLASESL